jgi:hypothetical protein
MQPSDEIRFCGRFFAWKLREPQDGGLPVRRLASTKHDLRRIHLKLDRSQNMPSDTNDRRFHLSDTLIATGASAASKTEHGMHDNDKAGRGITSASPTCEDATVAYRLLDTSDT